VPRLMMLLISSTFVSGTKIPTSRWLPSSGCVACVH